MRRVGGVSCPPASVSGRQSGMQSRSLKATGSRAMKFVDAGGLSPRLITVNRWNEWSEGSYLEPDTVYDTRYLEAVAKAMKPEQVSVFGVQCGHTHSIVYQWCVS